MIAWDVARSDSGPGLSAKALEIIQRLPESSRTEGLRLAKHFKEGKPSWKDDGECIDYVLEQTRPQATTTKSELIQHMEGPLQSTTRTIHRNLLIVSSINIFVSCTGAIPTKVSALGVDLPSHTGWQTVLAALLVVNLYLAASYGFNAWTDRSRHAAITEAAGLAQRSAKKAVDVLMGVAESLQDPYEEIRKTILSWVKAAQEPLKQHATAHWLGRARGSFDLWLPVGAAVLALLALGYRFCVGPVSEPDNEQPQAVCECVCLDDEEAAEQPTEVSP